MLCLYVAGIFPAGMTTSAKNLVKVKITHSHDHGHDHHHGEASESERGSLPHDKNQSHTHEVLVSASAPTGNLVTWNLLLLFPVTTESSFPVLDIHSQAGPRLSAIFRPPIS